MAQKKETLKKKNIVWLCGLVVFDALIISLLVTHTNFDLTNFSKVAANRLLANLLIPAGVLILTSILSHKIKAILVFWRLKNVLPGHDAFTKHVHSDSRIDVESLRANVGELPTKPAEQNATWYKLYKKVEHDEAVSDSHQSFLLFRDMAALSLLMSLGSLVFLPVAGLSVSTWSGVALVFILQYIISAICARNHGVRFVTNVLALHSIKKVR